MVGPHRAGHEKAYHPGETNVRMADVFVINKVNTADPAKVIEVRNNIYDLNPRAVVIEDASPVVRQRSRCHPRQACARDRDGPTLTRSEMTYGAGWVAAKRYGAGEIVDPRPFAVGYHL